MATWEYMAIGRYESRTKEGDLTTQGVVRIHYGSDQQTGPDLQASVHNVHGLLVEYGAAGWELTAVEHSTVDRVGSVYWLKRPKLDVPE